MFVSASMHDVMITLTEALLLVFAVVFLFLQSWRTTLITGIAIPVSLIGTLAVMYAMGFSLNTVSMLGMVLAIGLVVDDAIVVVENVERQLENGLAPLTAAKVAMSEVTGPIIATSAVLGAVFVPVAFLPGVTGRLYNQFALTIAISIAISAFNSLTLSPALCAVLLRHRPPPSFFVFRKFNQGFDWTARTYGRGVRQLAKMRYALLALFAIGIAATAMLYMRLPSGFLPTEDRGYFYVIIQLPDGASLQRTDAMTAKARSVIMKHPAMSNMISLVGLNFLTGSTGSNSAAGFAILKPWEERGTNRHRCRCRRHIRPAVDPRHRPDGRLRIPARGFDQPRRFRPRGSEEGADRGGEEAARDRSKQSIHDLQHDDAAIQIRPRPRQN